MNRYNTNILVSNDDYDLISAYIRGRNITTTFDRRNVDELATEMKKAKVLPKTGFPLDVVQLNSRVKVRDEAANKTMELTVVTPEKANIHEKKISFMSPIGIALLGYSEGDRVRWNVPSGKKEFTILEVINGKAGAQTA